MAGARLSLAVAFAEKYTLMLLALAGGMLMARLLTPQQIGVYSIAAVAAGMAHILRDFGVGQYLIATREIGRQEQRAALTVSLACACLLATVLMLAAPLLARFYGVPELQPALSLLSLNFLLLPVASQTLCLLRRSMRVGAIYAINVTHGAAQLAITAWLALRGYGTLSLAGGSVGASVTLLVAALLLRPRGMSWLPGLKGVRAVLAFGLASAGGNLIDEMGVAAPDLIVGRLLGAAEVALLGKAQGLLSLFNQAIGSAVSPVVFPLYSQQAREGGDLRGTYLLTVSHMTAISWPFFTFLGILPLPVIKLLYGIQWDEAATLMRIMCLPVALYSMFTMSRHLFAALGQVRAQARLDTAAVALRVGLLLPAALADLRWVAVAVAAGALYRVWLTGRLLSQLAGIGWTDLRSATAGSAQLALWTSAAPLAAAFCSGGSAQTGAPALAAAMACALAFWLLGLRRLRHPLGQELALAVRKAAARLGFG
jgi:O-antigen/teichoic acid export membrane protein